MAWPARLRRLVRRIRARLATRRAAAAAAAQALALRVAYRPREVVAIALLATGLLGGLLVSRWRAAHPALAARLEAEPERPAGPPAPFTPRRRARREVAVPRCEPAAAPPLLPAPAAAGTGDGGSS